MSKFQRWKILRLIKRAQRDAETNIEEAIFLMDVAERHLKRVEEAHARLQMLRAEQIALDNEEGR